MNAKKMAKHFELDIAEGVFAYRRRTDAIAAEAALDGLYVVRTSVGRAARRAGGRRDVQAPGRGRARLPGAQGRRPRGPADLPLARGPGPGTPVPVLPGRLCPLAPQRAWAPLLFRDEAPPARTDPVAPPERSPSALAKERDHRTPDGLRVGSFATLMAELATLTRNRSCRRDSARRRRSTCCPSRPRSRPGRSS